MLEKVKNNALTYIFFMLYSNQSILGVNQLLPLNTVNQEEETGRLTLPGGDGRGVD